MSWRENHIDQELPDVSGKRFLRENFHNCTMNVVRGAVFEHCRLAETRIAPKRLSDLLGVTLTIDCFSFDDMEFNELAFDGLLFLISRMKGNDEKRQVLLSLISPLHKRYFEREFKQEL